MDNNDITIVVSRDIITVSQKIGDTGRDVVVRYDKSRFSQLNINELIEDFCSTIMNNTLE